MRKFYTQLVLILTLCSATAAHAVERAEMELYFEKYSEMWGAPRTLIMAIAEVESGMRPWAINISGNSYYLDSKEDAIRLIEKAVREKKSYDVGVMQINSYWFRRFGLDPADILEPRLNIMLGSWILAQELRRYGVTWKAIGAYHTPIAKNPDRAKAYANRVLKIWKVNSNERLRN